MVKIATTARRVADARRALDLLALGREAGVPTIALAMGEAGLLTRVLAPKFGGFLTFGALSKGRESAPGQPTVGELRDMYRLPSQTAATRVFGVIGQPIGHSKSPAIHNAALAAAGVDAVYVPLLVDDLRSFLDSFGDLPGFDGFSVTLPHKEAALALAAEAHPVARDIGAANTLVRRPAAAGGGFAAYNTDWLAAVDAVQDALGGCERSLKGLTTVVVGAGGAARALAFGASERGARVVVVNRTRSRADELAAAVRGESADWADLQVERARVHRFSPFPCPRFLPFAAQSLSL